MPFKKVLFTLLTAVMSIMLSFCFVSNAFADDWIYGQSIFTLMEDYFTYDTVEFFGSSGVRGSIQNVSIDTVSQGFKGTGLSNAYTLTSSNYSVWITGPVVSTSGVAVSASASAETAIGYSGLFILGFKLGNITPSAFTYSTKCYVSSNVTQRWIEALGVCMQNQWMYIIYCAQQGELINSSVQFTVRFDFEHIPTNNVRFWFEKSEFMVATNQYADNSRIYIGAIYKALQTLIASNSISDVDLAEIEDNLKSILEKTENIDQDLLNVYNQLVLEYDLINDIDNNVNVILDMLRDPTDNISWLEKIHSALIGSADSSVNQALDNATNQLNDLDNSYDMSIIDENLSNFDDVGITQITDNNTINKLIFWKRVNDNTFNALKTDNIFNFTLLYSMPVCILLLLLLI